MEESLRSEFEGRNPDWPTDSSTPLLKLPISEHGDIEVIGGVPKDLVHVKEPRVGPTCKRLGIPYAKAMVGWDETRNNSYPRHSGIVIRSVDFPRLQKALDDKRSKRQKKLEKLPVLAALFTLNRRAKRCRDLAQIYYQSDMHGLAGAMKSEKNHIYRLKGQVLHYMVESGVLVGGTFHRFEFGNWAEVLEGDGYRFHRPCRPQTLVADSQQIQSVESKPKGAKESTVDMAYEVVERFLHGKPRASIYEWPSKARKSRHQRWDDDDDDDIEDGWSDEEDDHQLK